MATYVASPPTQSGVGSTRTSITRNFDLYSAYVEIIYEVSSEAGFDFFRIYVGGSLAHTDSGTGVGLTSIQIPTSGGNAAIRLEYEKDGSDNAGTDNVIVHGILIVDNDGGSLLLMEDYQFSGTSGTGPPTGWTEILNDGGTPVTGSHWTLTDTSGGGAQTVSPPLVSAAPSVFSPAVVPGAVTVSPPLVDASPSIFAPTITQAGAQQDITVPLVDASPSIFEPTVVPGAVTVTVPLVSAEPSVFAPTVVPGTVTVSAPLVDASPSVFAPTIAGEYRAPDLAGFLLANDGRHRAFVEADDFRPALRGSRVRAALEGNNHTAAVDGSTYTAAISEG
jgi:hypothetical protein